MPDSDRPLAAARDLRDRLLGEHLGREEREVRAAIEREGSLVRALDALRPEGGRTLVDVEPQEPDPELERAMELGSALADPETPEDPETVLTGFLARDLPDAARSPWPKAAALAALAAAAAAAWRLTPLREVVSPGELRAAVEALGVVGAPVAVAAGFTLASLALVPVTLLIVATALAFDLARAVAYSLVGVLAAAATGFALGRALGRHRVRRLGGSRLNALSRRLARSGAAAVAAVRLVPSAPFTVVNLVAGASRLRLRDFLLGTVAGTAPGILAVGLLSNAALGAAREPGPASAAALAAAALAVLGGFALVRRLVRSRER